MCVVQYEYLRNKFYKMLAANICLQPMLYVRATMVYQK